MDARRPQLIILAGPNGAGKSTSAPDLLRDAFAVDEFVNADAIALGLSAFSPDGVALEAGKIMLRRLRELAEKRVDFAFETTLASRSFAPRLRQLRDEGYAAHLFFLSLPNADFAVERVRARVLLGGHSVDDTIIRRRFDAGLRNFFQLYMPVLSSWIFYDNSLPGLPTAIARGDEGGMEIFDHTRFREFEKRAER